MSKATNHLFFVYTSSLAQSGSRGKAFSCFYLSLLLIFFPAMPAPAADWKTEKKNIEQQIRNQSISINQLEQGLKLQQEQAQEKIAQAMNLLAELNTLDAKLVTHGAKLRALEDSMATQKELIIAKEREILPIQAERQMTQMHLQTRIRAYYMTGRIGMINIAFSAQTLPELLSIHDAFNALLTYDQDLLRHYRETLEGLEQSQKALTLEKTLLDTFIAQAGQEQEALEATREEKKKLLHQIETQTKLHEIAAREIEKAAGNLSAQVAVMQQKEELYSRAFLMHKGKLSPPVKGKVLGFFGQPRQNKLGTEGTAAGISLDAPDGTRVKAIFEGTVSYAGYLRGYGNTLIIDHGFEYYTVVARIETLLKKEGDTVKTGEDIGIMGGTATLIEEGLYVEIRHGEETEDPLNWLDKNKVILP